MSNPVKKLSSSEAADIRQRDIAIFVLLQIITLGIYWFYVCYQWSKELNGLHGRVKYQPVVVLLVNILTCGLAGLVFEIIFAFDIAQQAESRGVAGRIEQLPMWVIVCNCVALVAALTTVGIVVAFPMGILASTLVQLELNNLADIYAAPKEHV